MSEHKIDLSQLAKIKDGSGHSIFGASGSHMWLNCTGSLIPNLLAKDEAGYDAAWGTVAHGVTEEWLLKGRAPEHLLGKKVVVGDDIETWHQVEIDESMLWAAEQCVDRCDWEPGEHVVELHVDYSHLTPIPNQGGTLDFAALRRYFAKMFDHKFGKSPDNIVYAEDNSQLMLYAIGLLNDPRFKHLDLKNFVLGINQPRLDHYDEWEVSRSYLLEFGEYASIRMHEAWSLDAPRTPGPKQCRFCRIKASCPENAKMQEDLLGGVFSDESLTTVEDFTSRLSREDFELRTAKLRTLTIEQKARLLPFRKSAEAWWSALQADLEKAFVDGAEIPGYKAVAARTRRKFRNPAQAERHLLSLGIPFDELVEERMVTPAQAEKVLLRHKFKRKDLPEVLEGLIYKPEGKATLVPLSDRRPALRHLSADAFQDETQTDETQTDETEEG